MKINRQIKRRARGKQILKSFCGYLLLGIGTALFVILLRIFLFASYKIPSHSMEPALLPGDYIIVNKQIPGPRILTSLNFKERIKTKRIKGSRPIRRNEIIVFNFPYTGNWDHIKMDFNLHYVKRCIALPGDTFAIRNGFYKVAGCSERLGCYIDQWSLSERKEEELQRNKDIYYTFPRDSVHYPWTMKNFGPLYVPRRDDLLRIDTVNILLYKNLIEYETKQKITLSQGQVLLDGKPMEHYLFRENYYFVCGDKVLDSCDSRYWGLLPEDHIIGKVAFIWKSQELTSGKYRLDRFFKTVQ